MSCSESQWTSRPLATVVIVNFNGRHHLEGCLHALAQQTLPRECWEVVLVDNGSSDGSVAFVRACFPWVRLVLLNRNVGFAAGNNVAFRQAQGRYIALLNNDTTPEPRWLEELLAVARASPWIGGVAAKLRFHHDPALLQSTGLTLLRDGRGSDRGFQEVDVGQYDQGDAVFGGCGAAMLIRRELLEDVGMFDECLFMYYEDLDLAWRARMRGWQFVYAPKAAVRHVHCGTSEAWSPFFWFHVERNRVLVNLKNNSLVMAMWVLVGFLARIARTWWRIARDRNAGQTRLAHGWAHLRAFVSLFVLLPHALGERYRIRSVRRLVADRYWMNVTPAPAARRGLSEPSLKPVHSKCA